MVKKHQKTAQRVAVMNFLKNNKNHPTVMDIFHAVSKKLTTVSLTTIYNTIDLLKEEGVVRELPAVLGHGAKYEVDMTPHHHLICTVCGTFVDTDLQDVHQSIFLSDEQRHGFDVNKISIKIYGVCPKCKNSEAREMKGLKENPVLGTV